MRLGQILLFFLPLNLLIAHPIDTSGSFTWDLQGNPIGGKKQGFAQAASWSLAATVDLNHYLGWKETTLNGSMYYRSGVNLSHRYIDNIFWAAQVYGGETWWINELYIEKEFCNQRLVVEIGRINIGGTFGFSPLYLNYVNSGINDFVESISENVFFHDTPYATWAAIVEAHPHPKLTALFGCYNANEHVTNNNTNGFNFQFKNTQGVAWITEWTFKPSTYLEGHYSVGSYYYNGSFDKFKGGAVRGNWGVYIMLDQTIYREGKIKKVTPFVTFAYAPKAMNLIPYFASGGLVIEGPFKCRPLDVAAFGFCYGSFSPDRKAVQRATLPRHEVQNFEMMFEATYAIQASHTWTFQPDLQYIVKPNGRSDRENAWILGFQIVASF